MKHIKITQGAYLNGYDGAFYRFNDEEGDELSTGLWHYWYEARAKDEDGEEYTVIWKSQTKKLMKMAMKHTPANGATLHTLRIVTASA